MMVKVIKIGKVAYKVIKHATVLGDVMDGYDLLTGKKKIGGIGTNDKLTKLEIKVLDNIDGMKCGDFSFQIASYVAGQQGKFVLVYEGLNLNKVISTSGISETETLKRVSRDLPFSITTKVVGKSLVKLTRKEG